MRRIMKKPDKKIIILSLLLILVLGFSQLAFSRAGGGGSSSLGSGGGSGGGSYGGGSYGGGSSWGRSYRDSSDDGFTTILAIFLLPFYLLYAIVSKVEQNKLTKGYQEATRRYEEIAGSYEDVSRKYEEILMKYNEETRKSREILEKLEAKDSSWDLYNIKADIEMAYFKVQEAWMERDQSIAREYMSDRLYNKHKTQTDLMIKQHRKNILLNINLIDSTIVQVVDYKDDSKDMMWVLIKGSMIDYIIDDRTGEVLSGDPDTAEIFYELWRFVRGRRRWVLDEIDQTVTPEDFEKMKSFSEELGA